MSEQPPDMNSISPADMIAKAEGDPTKEKTDETTRCYLLELQPELRLQIYEHLSKDLRSKTIHLRRSFYGKNTWTGSGVAAWKTWRFRSHLPLRDLSRTCRTLKCEVTPILDGTIVFQLELPRSSSKFRGYNFPYPGAVDEALLVNYIRRVRIDLYNSEITTCIPWIGKLCDLLSRCEHPVSIERVSFALGSRGAYKRARGLHEGLDEEIRRREVNLSIDNAETRVWSTVLSWVDVELERLFNVHE
jgi:hypothetical protein